MPPLIPMKEAPKQTGRRIHPLAEIALLRVERRFLISAVNEATGYMLAARGDAIRSKTRRTPIETLDAGIKRALEALILLANGFAGDDVATGWLPLPADTSDAAIRECAVAWINGLPESERVKALRDLADHVPDAGRMVAENERLREALRPFAALAREIEFYAKQMGVEPEAFAKACTWPDLTAARAAMEDSNV